MIYIINMIHIYIYMYNIRITINIFYTPYKTSLHNTASPDVTFWCFTRETHNLLVPNPSIWTLDIPAFWCYSAGRKRNRIVYIVCWYPASTSWGTDSLSKFIPLFNPPFILHSVVHQIEGTSSVWMKGMNHESLASHSTMFNGDHMGSLKTREARFSLVAFPET